jgi:hypothetical protein
MADLEREVTVRLTDLRPIHAPSPSITFDGNFLAMRAFTTPVLVVIGMLMTIGASAQQCPDISVGSYDGTPLLGNANTPFPTNTGSNDRRGARRQYIYPASELLAAGVCAGLIQRITFYGLDREFPCDANVTCPSVLVDLRIGNSALTDFGPYVESQSTPLSVDWDAATEVSAQMNTYAGIPFVVDTGMIHFQLMGAGFQWNGVSNIVLDISWLRAAPNGNSPPVALVENLPYTACKWVQVLTGTNVTSGNTYQDNPLPANATTGTTFNRPVTTFNSTAEVALAMSDNARAGGFGTYFDPTTGDAVVTRTGDLSGNWSVVCADVLGAGVTCCRPSEHAFPYCKLCGCGRPHRH